VTRVMATLKQHGFTSRKKRATENKVKPVAKATPNKNATPLGQVTPLMRFKCTANPARQVIVGGNDKPLAKRGRQAQTSSAPLSIKKPHFAPSEEQDVQGEGSTRDSSWIRRPPQPVVCFVSAGFSPP
jgi:hypothetical protein